VKKKISINNVEINNEEIVLQEIWRRII